MRVAQRLLKALERNLEERLAQHERVARRRVLRELEDERMRKHTINVPALRLSFLAYADLNWLLADSADRCSTTECLSPFIELSDLLLELQSQVAFSIPSSGIVESGFNSHKLLTSSLRVLNLPSTWISSLFIST